MRLVNWVTFAALRLFVAKRAPIRANKCARARDVHNSNTYRDIRTKSDHIAQARAWLNRMHVSSRLHIQPISCHWRTRPSETITRVPARGPLHS